MDIGMILKLIPWSFVSDIMIEVVKLVVDDEDNDFTDDLHDAVKNTLKKAEDNHPDY